MSNPLLEIKGLKKYFSTPKGMLHAVDNITLQIPRGQTLGVVGESGCGKTTLGRTILRLVEPTAGEILFEGKNIIECNKLEMKKLRREMQIIFQDPYSSLNPRLSVSQIIKEPLIVNKLFSKKSELEQRVKELMDVVGLSQRLINSYPHEMDGGRRQRVGIARALATNPKFIVCDEPVSALDVSIQAQIINLLMDLQEQQHISYLFITHDLSVVKHISDVIAVMYLGQCVELAPKKELFQNPKHPYTKALLKSIPVIDISKRGEKFELIKGEVSSPIEPVEYCRFFHRCKYAKDICKEYPVELKQISEGHLSACCRNYLEGESFDE
ncbi:ABC transporter ATP-binding protein [Guggenheimella bovis]